MSGKNLFIVTLSELSGNGIDQNNRVDGIPVWQGFFLVAEQNASRAVSTVVYQLVADSVKAGYAGSGASFNHIEVKHIGEIAGGKPMPSALGDGVVLIAAVEPR